MTRDPFTKKPRVYDTTLNGLLHCTDHNRTNTIQLHRNVLPKFRDLQPNEPLDVHEMMTQDLLTKKMRKAR